MFEKICRSADFFFFVTGRWLADWPWPPGDGDEVRERERAPSFHEILAGS